MLLVNKLHQYMNNINNSFNHILKEIFNNNYNYIQKEYIFDNKL